MVDESHVEVDYEFSQQNQNILAAAHNVANAVVELNAMGHTVVCVRIESKPVMVIDYNPQGTKFQNVNQSRRNRENFNFVLFGNVQVQWRMN